MFDHPCWVGWVWRWISIFGGISKLVAAGCILFHGPVYGDTALKSWHLLENVQAYSPRWSQFVWFFIYSPHSHYHTHSSRPPDHMQPPPSHHHAQAASGRPSSSLANDQLKGKGGTDNGTVGATSSGSGSEHKHKHKDKKRKASSSHRWVTGSLLTISGGFI